MSSTFRILALILPLCGFLSAAPALPPPAQGSRIVLLGNGLGERMQYDGYFETLLHLRYPDRDLTVRNLCFPGDTPAFRPRAGRGSQWAFPGAEKLRPEYRTHRGNGIEPSPDEWLTLCKPDTILAFFGYNESFDGPGGVAKFSEELDAWITHSQSQKYNGRSAPAIVLISPIAYEGSRSTDRNKDIAMYANAMRKVAAEKKVGFADLFTSTKKSANKEKLTLTSNGFLPNDDGNRRLAPILADALYGTAPVRSKASAETLRQVVIDKGWFFRNDYRILNGVHVYGRRRAPYGRVNYPPEIEKTHQMTANRDMAIHAAAKGRQFDLVAADAGTLELEPVKTNFKPMISFKSEEDSTSSITMMDGFKIEVFATEERFPDLRNPVQMSFDNRGRLWIAVTPSYPHYRPGDPAPDDKLLIFEDADGDGKADKQTVFADKLHLPMGFELQSDGVYVAQEPNLMLLRDTDGDDQADEREIVLHGFDSHDTHHAIGAFCADPTGAIQMAEGVFLHSQVETAHGPRRDSGSGVWRFDPKSRRLDRFSQASYANPWGIAYDDWGQAFLSDASNGNNWWLLPLSAKVPFGVQIGMTGQFAPKRARPTSGSEFISSRHFPDELQGGFMVNNVIGFLGTSIHDIKADGSGFAGKHRGDLLTSKDPNFRPCDLEFAPDGSLYLLDWHNPLIGHMQHSARDPNRDHDHGRIYRITYPSRPLVTPVPIAGAPVADLLKALEEPEYRTRYRARRELRGRDADEVMSAVKTWLKSLDPAAPRYDHHLCEALWTSAGTGKVDPEILQQCLGAKSHQARAAAVDIMRFSPASNSDERSQLLAAASDEHPQVRLAAMVAASWMGDARAASRALEGPVDSWMTEAYKASLNTLKDDLAELSKEPSFDISTKPRTREFLAGKLKLTEDKTKDPEPKLARRDLKRYREGKEIYSRDVHCATCHQSDGMGDAIYPPLAGSEWATGDETRLIKLVLKGIWGPITVKGKTYDPKNGVPPMLPFEDLLKDEEVAAVLTYVRNSFGNSAPAVKPESVARIRKEIKTKCGFYTVEDLLKQHPF